MANILLQNNAALSVIFFYKGISNGDKLFNPSQPIIQLLSKCKEEENN